MRREVTVQELIEIAGSKKDLARMAGVSRQAIQQWKRVPPERVVAICRHIPEIDPIDLRPDFYPFKEWVIPTEALLVEWSDY